MPTFSSSKSFLRGFSFVLIGLAGLIAAFAPLSNNPDAQYYYSVALRVSRGELTSSVDGLYSPLLSWLMAMLVVVGISLPVAFRVIAFASLSGIVLLLDYLCCADTSHPTTQSVTEAPQPPGPSYVTGTTPLLLTFLNLGYLVAGPVTGDLLAAFFYLLGVVCLWSYVRRETSSGSDYNLIITGVAGALAFYAKTFFGIAFGLGVVSLCFIFPTRRYHLLKVLILLTALCIPWVLVLSFHYETPTISAQQFLGDHPNSRYDYSPLFIEALTEPDREGPGLPNGHITRVFDSWSERSLFSLSYLYTSLRNLFFGSPLTELWFLTLVASVVFLPSRSLIAKLSVTMVVPYLLLHLLTWGPYLRYYLGILPLLHLLVASGAELCFAHFGRSASRRVHVVGYFCLFTLLSAATATTVRSVAEDWEGRVNNNTEPSARCLTSHLTSKDRIITGNITSPIPGLAAAMAKREYWSHLYSQLREPQESIARRLRYWGYPTVIWVGATDERVHTLAEYEVAASGKCAGKKYTIYRVATKINPVHIVPHK